VWQRKKDGAATHLISVIEELPKYAATLAEVEAVQAEAARHYRAIQEAACRQAARHGVKAYDRIVPGHEVQTIVQYAEMEIAAGIAEDTASGALWTELSA